MPMFKGGLLFASTLDQLYTRDVVEHTPFLEQEVLKLNLVDLPLRHNLKEKNFDKKFFPHIKRFALALDAYNESKNKAMTLSEVIALVASGPSGLEQLEDIRRKAFLVSIGADSVEYEEELEKIPLRNIADIGEIFNYKYGINWKINKTDFLDYSFSKIEAQESRFEDFRNTFRSLLEQVDDLELVDEYEILTSPSASSTYSDRHKVLYESRLHDEQFFAKSIGETKLTPIQTGPNSFRDAVTLKPASLNMVQLIERQVRKLLPQLSPNIVFSSKEEFEVKYSRFKKKNRFFFCRDIKKEGLTKPRILLKILLEELHAKFPSYRAFKNPDFYEDFSVRHRDIVFRPERGHGLGMANSLTSLMQLVNSHMLTINHDVFICNDDIIFGTSTEEEIDTLISEDLILLDELGIIVSRKKSFKAFGGGVFCEEYFSRQFCETNEKESYKRFQGLIPLLGVNIAHAKELYNSFDKVEYYSEEVISTLGYEFSPCEKFLPGWLGGWGGRTALGYNEIPAKLDITSLNPFYQAMLVNFPRRKVSEVYLEILEIQGLKGARSLEYKDTLEFDFYKSKLSDINIKKLYDLYKERRFKAFKKASKAKLMLIDAYRILTKLGNPLLLSEEEISVEAKRDKFFDPYAFKNEISAARAWSINRDIKEFYPLVKRLKFRAKGFSLDSKRKAFFNHCEKFEEEFHILSQSYYSPELVEQLHNPEEFIKAQLLLETNADPFPKIRLPLFQDEGIELKKSFYGRFQQPSEYDDIEKDHRYKIQMISSIVKPRFDELQFIEIEEKTEPITDEPSLSMSEMIRRFLEDEKNREPEEEIEPDNEWDPFAQVEEDLSDHLSRSSEGSVTTEADEEDFEGFGFFDD